METMLIIFPLVGSTSRTYDQSLAPVSILILYSVIYSGLVYSATSLLKLLGWTAFSAFQPHRLGHRKPHYKQIPQPQILVLEIFPL